MWDWGLVMSGVATVMSIATAWQAGKKRISAWTVGLVTQVAWLAYALVTGHWPFLVSTVAFTGVYIRNIVLWRRPAGDEETPVP